MKGIKLWVVLALVAVIFTPAWGQAATAKGENVVVPKPAEITQLADGQVYATAGSRQVCVTADPAHPLNGASGDCDGACVGPADGEMTCMGSCTWVDRDGDLAFFTWNGQNEGSWAMVGGSGKWAAAKGQGTWKATAMTAGGFGRNAWEGTIEME